MPGRIREHLTYANVMSTIAAFAAIGGGVAWALEANSVKSKHIVNEQVKAVDIKDGEVSDVEANDAVNAARLDGYESSDLMFSDPLVDGADPEARGVQFVAYSMLTDQTGDSYAFGGGGELRVENVGVADKFRVCSQFSPKSVTVYVGGVRTQHSIPANMCTPDQTIPDDGDFSIAGNRSQIFGFFSGNSEDQYQLLGFTTG